MPENAAASKITTKHVEAADTALLGVWHRRVHAAFDGNRLGPIQKQQAIELNLMIHQELSARDQRDEVARLDLDFSSGVFGIQKGLASGDLVDMELPAPVEGGPFDDEREISLIQIEKRSEVPNDKQIIFGVVMEPDSVDAHGDIIADAEIKREAHLWLARRQILGFMHKEVANSKFEIYESYVAPSNLTINKQKVKKGTWLLMLHVLDAETWKQIIAGEITGFSIGGFARRRKL